MRTLTRLAALPLLVFGLLLSGCDSSGDDEPAINGLWRGTDDRGEERFIYIDSQSFDVYDQVDSDGTECYNLEAAELEQISGNEYRVTESVSGATFTLTIRVENGNLITDYDGEESSYGSAQREVSDLPLC